MIRTVTYMCMSYNYARYMPANRDALLQQTRQADRVLVTDDHSDDTAEEIQEIWKNVAGIEVIRNSKNMGSMPHARRNCELVTSDAYLMMSADDQLLDPTYIETACAILDQHPNVSVVFGGYRSIQDGEVVKDPGTIAAEPYTIMAAAELRKAMAVETVVATLCPVVRTSVHQKTPPYPVDNELAGDWIHWYLLMTTGDYARINHPVCDYRVHANSLFQTFQREQSWRALRLEAYDSLIAWPGLSAEDVGYLKAGQTRWRVRSATLKQLPGVMVAETKRAAGNKAVAWRALVHTVRERARARLHGLRARLQNRR